MLQDPSAIKRKLAQLYRESEEKEAQGIAKKTGHPYVDLRKSPISLDAVKMVPEADARAANLAVIQSRAKELAVAVFNPETQEVKKIMQDLQARGYVPKFFIASVKGLEEAWRLYQYILPEAGEITGKIEIKKDRLEDLSKRLITIKAVQDELTKLDFNKLVTTSLFEIVLAGALANRASDIHFEAEEKKAKIRFRIDGILHDIYDHLVLKNYRALVSRIKLLSGLKINIQTEAQDGRFTIGLTKKDVEMRVSTIPSEFGETVVMRVLDPDSINIGLEELGLREDDLVIVGEEIKKPNGLILNTGPTGSGKTTTLYAFLKTVNSSDIKIITIEDPIEYHLPGIEQTQVEPKTGYTFASGLRSILRQDPDVILVGEIRDLETAEIGMQASLTGHLVFSTLHTNDAVGAVPRLVDLGVKVTSVGPALSLVIAQRLVRRLCKNCKKPLEISGEMRGKIEKFLKDLPGRVKKEKYAKPELYQPVGCSVCNDMGYRGRVAVFEFLGAGPEFEEAILKEASEVVLKELAEKQEMVTMQEDAILKVLVGMTTFEEVEKATGPIRW